MVKGKYPDMKIVFLTGYDYFEYALSAIKLGADEYILKPVSKKDVEQILVKIIGKIEKERKEKNILENLTSMNHLSDKDIDEGSESIDIESIINSELCNTELSLSYLSETLGFSVNYLSTLI